ncbi:pseudaminic acid synthase [Pseudoalteromonas lipolytica]|uniref:N-acetylneuraminate synthase n=1 Tax=Pseudoalteromonas lipolytica TaxID=570156 RepID=A0ABY1GEL8_9GAMM|nr:pseudaminic acid synthase [Pseudoalteromonas lipolytica]MBE0351605.1 N-acetylneuraminate synthase [Pseudoalteromonas lipolytica LMEB 39]SFT49173.1 N-acetylneuraminate synthase [Pseudoalteromonas lipolytica]
MKSNHFVSIDGKKIGPQFKPYIVAELSANHNGNIDNALKAIEEAAKCGADAVKIQSYTPDSMTIDCDSEDFQIHGGLWDGFKLYDLYKWAHTPYEWHQKLFQKAKEVGITLFSTPFDESAVELLESFDVPAYKLASFEITDLPLIKRIAQTGKPLIISTGMASMEEIEEAITTARGNGCKELIALHCISAYPTPAEQANLATIADISQRFDVISGLSDHSLGTVVSVTSIALGACLIEKHFTLDRNDKGPDAEFSLEPNEFKRLAKETNEAYHAIGVAGYERKPVEEANMAFRRSIYFVADIKQGEVITTKHIRKIRPGYGLAPKYFQKILGQTVNQNITRGTATSWKLITNDSK